MQQYNTDYFKQVYWQDVRDEVMLVNPELALRIDDIQPDKTYPLIRVRYQYGDEIIKNGKLSVRLNATTLQTVHTPSCPEKIRALLSYSAIPLSLALNKIAEVYVGLSDTITPLNCIQPGSFFGLFENLKPLSPLANTPIWSVSAGTRSTFMLPKVNDANAYTSLRKKYDLPQTMPANLFDQWHVLKRIATPTQTEPFDWHCDILFFTDPWLEGSNSYAWQKFKLYLFKQGWAQTAYIREEHAYSFIWHNLSEHITHQRLKPSVYQLETLKHLISISLGAFPGFKPADDSNLALPTTILQKAYIEDYGLKKLPAIMHSHMLRDTFPSSPVYYSLNTPTLPMGVTTPPVRGNLKELSHLSELLNLFSMTLSKTDYPLPKQLHNTQYRYFHSTAQDNILCFKTLPAYDETLTQLQRRYPDSEFPTFSPFANGCIQIRAGI